MDTSWEPGTPGLLTLPSGRSVRGRGLSAPAPSGPEPEFGLYLLAEDPPAVPWQSEWVLWRDFRTPTDHAAAKQALLEAWRRAAQQRVEIACTGGRGRTGTALSCLAVIDGVQPRDAVAYVRRNYHPSAVETPWQRHYVIRFGRPLDADRE